MKEILKKVIPAFIMNWYYAGWSLLGALVYRNPSKHLKVIGITGTNGKTSVAHITTDLLLGLGVPTASISTLRFKVKDDEWSNQFKMTMPGRFHIQRFFRQAVDDGCKYVVMEVTSEGVVQKRHLGIQFDTVAFTNLTPEHIERHGSFENYKQAKGALFTVPHRVSVINADDKHSDFFKSKTNARLIVYSKTEYVTKEKEVVQAMNPQATAQGISFSIGDTAFQSSLLGEFNIDNSLTAISICVGQGFDIQDIANAFQRIQGVPGRAEVVMQNPSVVVDYAHTPDGLEKLYTMTHSIQKQGRMICVLGSAGGGRDTWKRPEMGKIAEKNCDVVILTDEDPYDEDPQQIIDSIRQGITDHTKVQTILDRRQAIASALKQADANDVVVVSGKGAEPIMMKAGGEKLAWDDRKVVREEWENIKK